MHSLSTTLGVLETATGNRIAPHVAAKLGDFTRHDRDALVELALVLTPEQLIGDSLLPDPLPVGSTIRRHAAMELLALADRRLLLFAAVSVVDSTAVLLSAASVETEAVLRGGAATHLRLNEGRFRFDDDRIRAVVFHDATAAERAEAHRRLAHALRAQGRKTAATWHAALGGPSPATAREVGRLLSVAEHRVLHGDFAAAQRIAEFVAQRASGELRVDACLLAGTAALWSGYLADAARCFGAAQTSSSTDRTADAVAAAGVVTALRRGPADTGHMKSRITEAMLPLLPMTMTPTDQAIMRGIVIVNDAFQQARYDEADSLQARLYLGAVAARSSGPWTTEAGVLSPLAESHLALLQTAFQMQANDFAGATKTLSSAVRRLPLVHAGAGVVSSYLRLLAPHTEGLDLGLAVAFERLAPTKPIAYNLFGVVMGDLSAAASRRVDNGSPAPQHLPTPWSHTLTMRELEVAHFVTLGSSNKDVAAALNVSTRTVEVHLGRVFRKMGVRSRSELIARALRPIPVGTSAESTELS